MLGEDNTPKPSELKPIVAKVNFKQSWSENTSPRVLEAGKLFKLRPVISKKVIYSASASGYVQARSQQTGQLLWSRDTQLAISSGPRLSDDILVIGGSDASVVALSAKDGAVSWRAKVSNQLLAPPIIKDKQVYAKTIDGRVYAFDAMNGKRLWRYNHGAPNLILRASSAPAVFDNIVLVGFADGKVDALNRRTGVLLWQRNISYAAGGSEVDRMIDIDATPIIKNHVAYVVNYQGEVAALALNDGRQLWRHKLSAFRDMAVSNNVLFIVDAHSHIWALNLDSGLVLWQQKDLHNRGVNAPALSKYGLVITDKLGFMHILSSKTGQIIARTQIGSNQTDVAPLIDKKDAYILFNNGMLTDYKMTVIS